MSPKVKPKQPIDIYVRVSRVNERSGDSFLSPDLQEEKARGMLAATGMEAGEVFVDLDESGGKTDRPGFQTMLDRIRTRQSGGVVVAKLSRLSRTVKDTLATVAEIESYGATFISCDPVVDTSTPYGRFGLTLFAALNELELDQHADAWATVRARRIAAGIHPGGTPPFGYQRTLTEQGKLDKLVPNPAEAQLVRDAFLMRSRGDGWVRIGNYLRDKGAGSRNWGVSNVSKMIGSEVYLGVAFDGDFRNADAHEPIVSRELYLAANSHKGEKSKGKSGGAGYLLSGLLVCAGCGRSLTRSSGGAGGRYSSYRCNSAKGPCDCRASVAADAIEDYVLNLVKVIVSTGTMTAESDDSGSEREQAVRNLDAAKAARDAWVSSDEEIAPAAFAARLDVLEARVAEAQTTLDELDVETVSKVEVDSWETFQTWDVPTQRALVGTLLGKMIVRKGDEPLTERVLHGPETLAAKILAG